MSSKREVLEWLALVEEPVVQQRLIQLQWIQNIVIDDRRVSLTVITLNNDEYSREKLPELINESGCHIFFMSSICSETFSATGNNSFAAEGKSQ